MKNFFVVLLVAFFIIASSVFYFVSCYNTLLKYQVQIEEQKVDIDVQLERRFELIPNLVKILKRYEIHESSVFSNIADARKALMQANSVEKKAEIEKEINSGLNRLIAIGENYPELKTDKLYIQLMDELAGSQNRITYAKQTYNGSVKEYNFLLKKIPYNFIANNFNFQKESFYVVEEQKQEELHKNFEVNMD